MTMYEVLTLVVQSLGLVAIIVYVKKTHDVAMANTRSAEAAERAVLEMRETRRQEAAPYVVVFCRSTDTPIRALEIVARNVGRTPAKSIAILYDPPFVNSGKFDLRQTPWLSGVIASLGPGQELSTVLDVNREYFADTSRPRLYRA